MGYSRVTRRSVLATILRFAAVILPALFLLSACGGGSSSSTTPSMTSSSSTSSSSSSSTNQNAYQVTYLVSNSTAISAQHTDATLVNAWGLAFNPQAYAWVSDDMTSTASLFDGNGNPPASSSGAPASISIPVGASGIGLPTGIVYNSTTGFDISANGVTEPATFIFDTLGGSIEGWNDSVDPTSAVVVYNSTNGAQYTGLTMATDGNGNYYLYAADFKNDAIDVFNSNFQPVQVGGDFYDSAIPSGYAPYGIQNLPAANGSARIYVAYAQPSTSAQHVAIGSGLGYVAVFQWDGTLISTLVSQGALNAPWGLAIAPSNFGAMSGALLVGNFGNGAINAYNATTGASMGPLMLSSGQQLFVPGLWAIVFGNGQDSQPTNTLFFTGGPDTQTAGVYGRIDLPGTYTPPSGTGGGSSGY